MPDLRFAFFYSYGLHFLVVLYFGGTQFQHYVVFPRLYTVYKIFTSFDRIIDTSRGVFSGYIILICDIYFFIVGKFRVIAIDAFRIDVTKTQRVASLVLSCMVSKLESLSVISFIHCSSACSSSSIYLKTIEKIFINMCL